MSRQCPTPHKFPYRTPQDAQAALARIFRRRHGARRERNAYRCPCGAWHLTSRPRKEHQ